MELQAFILTHQDCPVGEREKCSLTREQRMELLKGLRASHAVAEAAIVETCNRHELYAYCGMNDVLGQFIAALERIKPQAGQIFGKFSRKLAGTEVVKHLFEVSAGLDSQIIGENQVLAQLKNSYEETNEAGSSRYVFHKLFHQAFRVGKAVRNQTDMNCGAVSVAFAAVELVKNKLSTSASTVLLLGAGENAAMIARHLAKVGLDKIVIANRDLNKAAIIAGHIRNCTVIALEDIPSVIKDVDAVIGSTSSPQTILKIEDVAEVLANRTKKLLAVDVAVPRDIDPQIITFDCVKLYNIDDLSAQVAINIQKRNLEVPKAKAIVEDYVTDFVRWMKTLDIVPVITELTSRTLELARGEAKKYSRDFCQLDGERLECFAESLVKKLIHGPLTMLKSVQKDEPTPEQLLAAELVSKMFLSEEPQRR